MGVQQRQRWPGGWFCKPSPARGALQATAGSRQDVQLSAKDDQRGEASRIAVAGERHRGYA